MPDWIRCVSCGYTAVEDDAIAIIECPRCHKTRIQVVAENSSDEARTISDLVETFFRDLEQDHREATEDNLRAWLWFVCPAHLRSRVEPAIRANDRWPGRERMSKPLRFRVTESEHAWLTQQAANEGVTVSEFVRRRVLAGMRS